MTAAGSRPSRHFAGRTFQGRAAVALIALLLGIPMIGLTTVDQGGALRIATRWPTLFAFVAACFAGRLLLRYGLDHWRRARLAREQAAAPVAASSLAAVRC
jgi:branched-chain amino acid transport system permease protein